MAITNDNCSCGAKVVVFTGDDVKHASFLCDGFQVICAEDMNTDKANYYSLFRCSECGEPTAEAVPTVVNFLHPTFIGKNHGDA
ncbi:MULTISPECIES: hypothetical protein [Pseudoalteromonas]|uniref:Uncharacterized protein n=1 Tax=Pseudoalteromonas piscicida TaxID=43662 RepID=A0AAD0RH36_PSEO7|nr:MULTISPECIES: hypothetical protein [Pseudoalteromonas]ASD67708.1 hypothetical protein B1L02_12215 [Pseudoalteromonas piscicida]AXR01588.1 hypothetical protein D0511_05515 [Pseudoalteromonas piscicida]RXE95579.1 hypothetical protein D9603_20200 [Pseudoalteromonas sp. PS5]